MSELFLVLDNFDAELNPFANLEDVEAFLKSKYQQNPILYQVISSTDGPRLLQHEIPADWKVVDPDEEGETA